MRATPKQRKDCVPRGPLLKLEEHTKLYVDLCEVKGGYVKCVHIFVWSLGVVIPTWLTGNMTYITRESNRKQYRHHQQRQRYLMATSKIKQQVPITLCRHPPSLWREELSSLVLVTWFSVKRCDTREMCGGDYTGTSLLSSPPPFFFYFPFFFSFFLRGGGGGRVET